ncbi:aromatic ring-hydroxylating oxygenase subunit alpha [Pontibaca methylaminivorans]|uniref:aromatic ring-hydroxylating oxygenase subunit alpha n=1 Tax=Pontibaca methylaminivorans TaxID=515897 RepID=UPI002FD91AD4
MLNQNEIHQRLMDRKHGFALERDLYCDPGTYAADLQHIWYREWLFAVPACELPKPGAYATLQVGDYPILIVRGDDNVIRAFHNTCCHRGQRLAARERGSAPRIVCPYHQWTYNLDGQLIFARDMGPDFNTADYRLGEVHCADLSGLVYICLADEAPDITALAEAVAAYVGPSDLANARVASASTIIELGNWKLVVENNRECYHCGGVHPELTRSFSDNPKAAAMEGPNAASDDIIAHWKRCEAAGLPSRFVAPDDMQWRLARVPLLNQGESMTLSTRAAVSGRMGRVPFNDAGSLLLYHYPNTWNHFLADHAIVFRILPLSPTTSEVTTKWLVRADAVEGRDYDLTTLTEVWLSTNDEDRRVVEENQKGILSPAYRPGPNSPVQELGVIQFLDWYAALMVRRLQPDAAGAIAAE